MAWAQSPAPPPALHTSFHKPQCAAIREQCFQHTGLLRIELEITLLSGSDSVVA